MRSLDQCVKKVNFKLHPLILSQQLIDDETAIATFPCWVGFVTLVFVLKSETEPFLLLLEFYIKDATLNS